MTTIYAIMICLTSYTDPNSVANGCYPPENGMVTFRSAEDCRNHADRVNTLNPPQRGDVSKIELKCFHKPVQTWTPSN